jgi:hypothetical protein
MLRTAKHLRAIAALLIVVSLVLNTVPYPANADTADVAANPPTGWSIDHGQVGGGSSIAYAIDENDTTYESAGLNVGEGGCSSRTIHSVAKWTCSGAIEFARASGIDEISLSDFRLFFDACVSVRPACSTPSYWLYAIRLSTGLDSCSDTTGEIYYRLSPTSTDATWGDGYDTGIVSLDSDPVLNITTINTVCYQIQYDYHTGIAASEFLYTWELYGDVPGDTTVEEWVYGLRLDHPPFSRVISWHWAQSGTIRWWVTDSGGILTPNDLLGSPYTVDDEQRLVIFCSFICSHETYVLHVEPDGFAEATYSIDSDLSGELIGGTPVGIGITGVVACYNADYDQCDPGELYLATTVTVKFRITPDTATDIHVMIGSEYLFGPGFDGDAWYDDSTLDGGIVHVINATVTSPYPVPGQRLLIIATGPENSVQVLYGLDWVDGGPGAPVVGGGGSSGGGGGTGVVPCGALDPACAIRNAVFQIRDVLLSLFVPTVSIGEVVGGITEVLGEKWPFAWVVGGSTAIGQFYSAITTAMTETWGGTAGEWCYTNDLIIGRPTIASPGATSTSEGIVFCLDTGWIEDGFPEYRTSIRPMLGGGMYIFALFRLVAHFAPKPVVVG